VIKQFVPSSVCLQCSGCCRFSQPGSIWNPQLLDQEAKALGLKNKKIPLKFSQTKNIFFCTYFKPQDHHCAVYKQRPSECQLYPFLINRKAGKTYLAVDLNCPYVNKELDSPAFGKYAAYLKKILIKKHLISQAYPGVVDLFEIRPCSCA